MSGKKPKVATDDDYDEEDQADQDQEDQDREDPGSYSRLATDFLAIMSPMAVRVAVLAGVTNPVGAVAAGLALTGAGLVAKRVYDAFKVEAVPHGLTWGNVDAVQYVKDGYALGDAQFGRLNNPAGIEVVFEPAKGARLPVGDHILTARPKDATSYAGEAVTTTFKVEPVPHGLTWGTVNAVQYVKDGHALGDAQFGKLLNPLGIEVVFEPAKGARLPVGDHTLTARPKDATNYVGEAATTTFKVEPVPHGLTWGTVDAVQYVKDGYALGDAQFGKLLNPLGIEVVFEPAKGARLPVGDHALTARPKDATNYTGEAITTTFKVNKAAHRLTWGQLGAVDYVKGGYSLGDEQAKAVVNPLGLELEFEPKMGTPLNANKQQPLKVWPKDTGNYVSDPVETKLTINPAPHNLSWGKIESVAYESGGYWVLDSDLQKWIVNPLGLELNFVSVDGDRLNVGMHKVRAAPKDIANYVSTPVETEIKVNRLPVEFEWECDTNIPWMPGGVALTRMHLNASVSPTGVKFHYSFQNESDAIVERGTILDQEKTKIFIILDDNKNYESKSGMSKTFVVTKTSDQKKEERAEQIARANREKKMQEEAKEKKQKEKAESERRAKLSEKERKKEDSDLEKKKKAAEQLRKQAISNSQIAAEYPFGAADQTPHIHNYPSGFHLKDSYGVRYNLVQDGTLYRANLREAREFAKTYDEENFARLTQIIAAMVKPYE